MKLRPPTRGRRLIADIETDGLLLELTRIHLIGLRDIDTRETFIFRRNRKEDNILDGVRMLNEAELIVGHNWVGFDDKAIAKVYPDDYAPTGKVRDTMVMARMIFADIKEDDFRMWNRGVLPGEYIGSHELGAWGMRLGLPKDDYAKRRKEMAAQNWDDDPALAEEWGDDFDAYAHFITWGRWNQDMEDYLWTDLDATEGLWLKVDGRDWSETATVLEHRVHAMMEEVQANGFPFDREGGRALEADLEAAHAEKSAVAVEHFGSWWVPSRWLEVNGKKATKYTDPEDGKEKGDMPSFQPREAFGEDDERNFWGEVKVPSRSIKYKDPMKAGGDKTEGAPYCPIKLVTFNPNSRPQIINRLQKVYNWEPQPDQLTEKGNPSVSDEILRDLAAGGIAIAEELAEIFYYGKRLGQLANGPQAWLKVCEKWDGDGRIHCRHNVGGTVTNRASHSNPNIAQVPRVVFKKPKLLGPDGLPILDENGKPKLAEKKALMKGREGDHGWDCRNLFYVPDGWVLMGADQKGIELRCLGHYMAEFDNGDYGRLVVEADPHDLHQAAMELDSRDLAKTFIYAMIYGAQDYKLGTTIDPTLTTKPKAAKALGMEMRRRIMTRIPALGEVVKYVQREARRGYVEALDGRHLFVRAKHAALNTKLQGAAATIAKAWCVNFLDFCEDDGLVHGWDGDFAVLAWVHDEMQVAVRDDDRIKEICRRNIVEAAAAAGDRFDFRLPVDIDVKWGRTWAETH